VLIPRVAIPIVRRTCRTAGSNEVDASEEEEVASVRATWTLLRRQHIISNSFLATLLLRSSALVSEPMTVSCEIALWVEIRERALASLGVCDASAPVDIAILISKSAMTMKTLKTKFRPNGTKAHPIRACDIYRRKQEKGHSNHKRLNGAGAAMR
jgi:hypothetical protein